MPYASQQDLENALGVSVVTAIFDDDLDGVVDGAAIAACLESGDVEVDSALQGTYEGPFPFSPVPKAIKLAAIDFCCAYAARRRPDLIKAMHAEPWVVFRKAAKEKIDDFAKARLRLPASAGTPANVQTTVKVNGVTKPDGCPSRVFDKMGSF